MKNFTLLKMAAGIALTMGIAAQANAEAVYASYAGSQLGVTIRDVTTLNQYTFLNTAVLSGGVAATGIAVDSNNNSFLPAANHIRKIGLDGTLLVDMTFPDAGIVYTDVAVNGTTLYAAYKGSQKGVTIRNTSNLNQLSSFNTGVNAEGIAADTSGNIYIAFANNLRKYSPAGVVLANMTFPDPAIVYTSLVVKNGKVYATYRGSQQGVTVRDATTLNQTLSFNTGLNASGIGFDTNTNTIYVAAGNQLRKYNTAGTLTGNMTFPIASINYTGIAIK